MAKKSGNPNMLPGEQSPSPTHWVSTKFLDKDGKEATSDNNGHLGYGTKEKRNK